MNAETVKKEYGQELLRLELSGMAILHQEERKNQEELRKLEQEHQVEMSRLRGQTEEEEYQKRKFERLREEVSRRDTKEMKELERKNKREEEELREQRMKQFKESLRQGTNSANEEAKMLQKTLDQSLTLHGSLENNEKVKNAKKVILETGSMWANVNEAYDLLKLVYFNEDEPEFDAETKISLLKEVNGLLKTKAEFVNCLMTARRSLGEWRPVADEQCYQNAENSLNRLTGALANLERAITDIRKKVKLNKSIGGTDLSKIDSIMNQCLTLVDELNQNPMHTKKTFQQMLEN